MKELNNVNQSPDSSEISLTKSEEARKEVTIGVANLDSKTHQPKIVLTCKNLKSYCFFMVDSGSSMNLVKTGILKDTPVDTSDKLSLKVITKKPIKTLGSASFKIMGRPTRFYIVKNNFGIPLQARIF